jgi:histidine triad (HIT) family protein
MAISPLLPQSAAEVFHVHLHVFPRTPGDGFRIEADWRQRDRAELDAAAEQVRRGLRAL